MTGTLTIPDVLRRAWQSARKVVAVTGAGCSAESGIPTFRGDEGLWKNFRAEDLATPEAFEQDPRLVWEWYNWRREIVFECQPNPAHFALNRMERLFPEFLLVTQNVDGMHQRAGSQKIIEFHGSVWELRGVQSGKLVTRLEKTLAPLPPVDPETGEILRPNVVWFGEGFAPGILEDSFRAARNCDLMFSIGTSAVVYPAAALVETAKAAGATVVVINPDPTPHMQIADASFLGKAGEVLPALVEAFCEIITSTEKKSS